ncbi:MAG: RNA 2',3'-cyclic phosphodiesterase [Casimicrobiaceae bacterium]
MTSRAIRHAHAGLPASGDVRLFYAIWPDPPALHALHALARHMAAEGGGRATAPDNLHLTLAFVGTVRVAEVERLVAIGETIARATGAFPLTLDRLGSFRAPGVVWLGARLTPAPLQAMAIALGAALAAAGYAVDARMFKAHVTLARRCDAAPSGTHAQTPITWIADALTLTASTLAPGGPRYRELARFGLGAT